MSLANPSGAKTFSQIQEQIKGILTSEQPSNEEPTEAQEGDIPPKHDGPTPVQDDGSNAQDTPPGDTDTPSRRRKAKLGDREIEFDILTDDVDFDLIPKGLMMEADYRKKTTEVSEQRKALDEQKLKLDQVLSEAETQLLMEAKDFESSDMKELMEDDPREYLRQKNVLLEKVEKYKAFKTQREQELKDQKQSKVNSELSEWTKVIPDWLDDNRKAEDMTKIEKTLIDTGFTDQDWGGFSDRRMISLARKAMLYDQIQSQDVESKRTKSPVTHVASNSATENTTIRSKKDDVMSRARKTGKVKDAQAAIKAILGG